MKKRAISLLLTVVMLLSLLPTAAFAASAQTELKLHMMGWENGEQVELELSEYSMSVYNREDVQFYLHYTDGTARQLDPEDLSLPSFLSLEENDGEDWYTLRAEAVGTGEISCEVDGETYSVLIAVGLPDLGLYSQLPICEENLMDEVTISDTADTFYIGMAPELTAMGSKMTAVSTQLDSDIRNPNILEIGSVTLSDDGSYATVTVTDPNAEDNYHFEATVENQNGGPRGTWGRSVWINNDMPHLYFCYVVEDNGEWTVETDRVHSDLYCVPGNSGWVQFFCDSESRIAAGKATPVAPEDMIFPDYMEVEYLTYHCQDENAPEYAVRLYTTRFDDGDESVNIRYVEGGQKYTISAEPCLPDIGVYSQPDPGEDTFIYDACPFEVTEDDRTVYISVYDNNADTRLIGVEYWNDDYAEDMFTTSTAADGSYISVTAKDDVIVSNEEYGLRISYQHYNDRRGEWMDEDQYVWLSMKNGQPALMFRVMEWDDDNQEWYVPWNDPMETRMDLSTGNNMAVEIYYGTEDDYETLSLNDLTFPAGILSAYMEGDIMWLKGIGFEEDGVISYTDGERSAAMNVTVSQPSFALYSSTTAGKDTYLDREVEMDGTNGVVYLVARSGRVITGIESILYDYRQDVTDSFDIRIASDGSYAAISLKKDADGNLPAGGNYELEFTDSRGRGWRSFKLVRMDLPQLSTPTDLVWHRDYDRPHHQTVNDYQDRMGAMSFKVGELTQNHYALEIYSAADNYTSPVHESGWGFGDLDDCQYFSVTDFIYAELPSGTYKFRARAQGDGTNYRDSNWSELSEAFVYTAPFAQLIAIDAEQLFWVKENWETEDGFVEQIMAGWSAEDQEGIGYYEVNWFFEDQDGQKRETGGTFDIPAEGVREDGNFYEWMHDEILEENGNVPYFFKVRIIPADITRYCLSDWSDFSPALDMETVTSKINKTLESLIPDSSAGEETTLEEVQTALEGSTAELRAAMAADQSISGGTASGTLDLIRELEQTVANNVEAKVDAKNSAPQKLQDIADDIQMVGAALNFEDKHPGSGKTPTVTLEIDKPKKGIVIPEQQHNAVQFSMKLNGAVNHDNEAGQSLIVPIAIDMPVPAGINPEFLVVLHQRSDGFIEQIRPYIYLNESANRWHARFIVDSFSDFALVEYRSFAFDVDTVNKTVGDAPFVITPAGVLDGSYITYTSSNPEVAEVDFETGEVTILGAGTTTITATLAYPETVAEYTLVVAPKSSAKPSSGSSTPRGWVDVASCENGVVSSDKNAAKKGSQVTLTVTPDKGYKLDTLTVTSSKGEKIPVSREDDGTYTFTAPSGLISVSATFVPAVELPFADVAVNDWFFDAVSYVYHKDIMAGNGDGTFGPDQELTRAMVAQVLFNMDENGYTGAANLFKDVENGAWYTNAIAWAAAEGVVSGYGDGNFGTMDSVTREQLAVILHNYAVSKGCSVEGSSFLGQYTDSGSIAFWAVDAVEWAAANGILNADNGMLRPTAAASRAEVALALMGLCEQVMD